MNKFDAIAHAMTTIATGGFSTYNDSIGFLQNPKIEIVDIFRRPEFILPIVKEAVKIKAKVIWMQLGISDQPSHKQAVEHGLTVVMDKCIAEEHARIMTIQP